MRGFVLCRLIPSAVVLLTLGTPSISSSQTIDPDLPCTNGKVRALVADGDVLYLGGEFTLVGRHTGRSAALDAVTGDPIGAEVATPSAVVSAVVPDGDGGWFVGGSFYEVQKIFRQNLVHILADGSLAAWDPVWDTSSPAGQVFALALSGSTLYVGGAINTTIGGQFRNNLFAIDVATATVLPWNPNPNGQVNALAISGGNVLVGGTFSSIGGQSRANLAAIDASTGAATGWDPHATGGGGLVSVLAVSGGVVYAGGFYSGIGNAVRSSLAALDLTTGLATSFDAHLDAFAEVRGLAVTGATVYAGGYMHNAGGQPRMNLAAFDAATGNLKAWDPEPDNDVYSLATDGSAVYVGGLFLTIAGQPRACIAALDPYPAPPRRGERMPPSSRPRSSSTAT
jgi:hypothetical protein